MSYAAQHSILPWKIPFSKTVPLVIDLEIILQVKNIIDPIVHLPGFRPQRRWDQDPDPSDFVKLHGAHGTSSRSPRDSIGLHGAPWDPWDPWDSVGLHGAHVTHGATSGKWDSMGIHGAHGAPWGSMGPMGLRGPHRILWGSMWPMRLHGAHENKIMGTRFLPGKMECCAA